MSSGEHIITVSQAAFLVDMTQQTIRAWIDSGKLPAEMTRLPGRAAQYEIRLRDLIEMPGVVVIEERRIAMMAPETKALVEKRILELERRLAAVEDAQEREAHNAERIEVLERQLVMLTAQVRAAVTAQAYPQLTSAPAGIEKPLKNWNDRAAFLHQHGWSFTTTKGWRGQCPLNPRVDVLRFALQWEQEHGRRTDADSLRVRLCAVPDCPCHQLFASLSRAAADGE